MLRRRLSQLSISSANTISDESDNSNINDELPDAGLPKTKSFDAKGQKKTSVDFAVDVITQSGKFPGMGSIDQVHNATLTVDNTPRRRKTKAELKEIPDEIPQTDLQHEIVEEKKMPKEKKASASKGPRKKESTKITKEAKRKKIDAKRDIISRAIEEDKLAKADLEKVNNIYKPTECLKYITVEMHPSLGSAWFMADTAHEMASMGVRIQHVDTSCPCGLVVWSRNVPPRLATDGGQIKLAPNKKLHPQSLLIVQGERLNSIAEHVGSAHPHTRALILLINTKTIGCSWEECSKTVQGLQIDGMMDLKMDVIAVDSAVKLAKLIGHYTKAVAEAPYKKAKREIDEQAEFYMRGDNKNCVNVDKYGNGVSRLWEQMLSVLPHSSLEVARSLGAQYKNPQALMKDLRSPGGIDKVAELGVSRTTVPGAKPRRLGPELSRKLYTLFTAENGDVVIE